MSDDSDHTLDTYLQHAAMAPLDQDTGTAPVPLPSMRASTIRFRSLDALDQTARRKAAGSREQTYGRAGMATHRALEDIFCEIEHGSHAFLAPSGMAAITLALLSLLGSGDTVLVADCAYAPVRRLDQGVLSRMGIAVQYSRADAASLEQSLTPETRVLYVESPGSLLLEMLDMPMLADFARKHNLILVTDNTWGTGGLYYPLDLGVDVSVIAGTKYVAGHSDLMLGAVVLNDRALADRIDETHYAMGYAISADDVWLAIRGARTMPLRLRQSAAGGLQVAQWLAGQPAVKQVYHPAFPEDAGHALWQRDCHGSNGLLSIALDCDVKAARRFVDALTLFGIGFSWGGFESLVQLVNPGMLEPHGYWQGQQGRQLVRLYVGLESPDDLIADLRQALQALD